MSGQCRPTAVGYGPGWARIKCAESAVTDLAKKHNGTPDRQEKEHGIVGNNKKQDLWTKHKVCVGFLREEESVGEGGSPLETLLQVCILCAAHFQFTLSRYEL